MSQRYVQQSLQKEQDLIVRRLPKYYEVRWTEFTAGLIDRFSSLEQQYGVLWKVRGRASEGFRETVVKQRQFNAYVLTGRRFFLLKVFQKKLQGDDITIVDIVPETKKFIAKTDKLPQRPVLGGWEGKFSQNYKHFWESFVAERTTLVP